jgi:hypothetical protein
MTASIGITLGWPYPKRISFLAELTNSRKSKYEYPVRFQGSPTLRPVYAVQIDLPKYRLVSGRTQAAQEEYLAKNPELPPDFFTRDVESDRAQAIQHQLLWDMVRNTRLLSYFKDTATCQEQPLVLDHNGLVVNGNRRLCAMRNLFHDDATKYSGYSHVDVVILPLGTERDIDELEAYLQIQPDIRADYTWIAKACMLRARQQSHHYEYADLTRIYDMTEKDISSTLGQLGLVDEYLQSQGKPKQYDLVRNDEFAFKALLKERQRMKQDAPSKDLFTRIAFNMIGKGETQEGIVYRRIPEVRAHLPEISKALQDAFPVKTASSLPRPDLLILGNPKDDDTSAALVATVSEPANQVEVFEIVRDVIDGKLEEERKRGRANAVLKELTDANAHLKTAVICVSREASTLGIEEQIRAIEESVREIQEWLSNNARPQLSA